MSGLFLCASLMLIVTIALWRRSLPQIVCVWLDFFFEPHGSKIMCDEKNQTEVSVIAFKTAKGQRWSELSGFAEDVHEAADFARDCDLIGDYILFNAETGKESKDHVGEKRRVGGAG
jgi:hypothetical protein